MENRLLSDEDLHAFIDGELDDVRSHEVAAVIAASPELNALADAYAADKALLTRIYGPLIGQPVPPALRRPLAQARPQARVWPIPRVAAVAAAIAALVVAGLFGYPSFSSREAEPLVADALAVRAGRVHADLQFTAAQIAAPDMRDQLVAAALAVPVKAPDLAKAGYVLTGIAVYPDREHHRALQLSYRGQDGKLFTLYLRPTPGQDRFELTQRGPTQVCVWQNDRISVVMLGEMSAHDMLRVATATYADLDF